jgi:hypothetical protein
MSTSESKRHAGNPSKTTKVPVAGPPLRLRTAPQTQTIVAPSIQSDDTEDVEPALGLTPATLKGWAGSLSLHCLLLLTLGLWYFAAPIRRPITFEGRSAGSPNGVPEGLSLTGGLNTEIPMPDISENMLQNADESLLVLNTPSLESALSLRGGGKPSAGGGVANDNPGAGEGDGFGLARFGEGGEVIRGVAVKVGDPQFTLIWDTDADLDLHVIEPGGKEIYWESPKGKQGGELDVDNTKGLGPENIYWLVESNGPSSAKVKGPGPPGLYQWFVVYWGGFGGIPKPTHWKVRIKHDGKVTIVNGKFRALNERSRIYNLKVAPLPQPVPAISISRDEP